MSYPINHNILAEDFREPRSYTQEDAAWLLTSLRKMCDAYDNIVDNDLTDDEKRVLAQSLQDYMEGIEASDLAGEDKEWLEVKVSSIERKVLA